MSDTRYHLQVKFEIFGKSYDWKTSLNWPEPGVLDARIESFFLESYEHAAASYWEAIAAAPADKAEHKEIAELKRLLKKYPEAVFRN